VERRPGRVTMAVRSPVPGRLEDGREGFVTLATTSVFQFFENLFSVVCRLERAACLTRGMTFCAAQEVAAATRLEQRNGAVSALHAAEV